MQSGSRYSQDSNFEVIDRWPYGPGFSALIDQSTIFCSNGGVLQIGEMDVSGKISWISELFLPGLAFDIVKSNDRLYVAVDDQGISIVDISILANPISLSIFETSGRVFDIAVSNDTIYVAMGAEGLEIYDCLDWSEPQLIGSLKGVNLRSLELEDSLLYVSDVSTGLRIINVAEVSTPEVVSTLSLSGQHYGLALDTSRKRAFVCSFDGNLNIVDVSNPVQPSYVTTLPCFGAWAVDLSDSLAYVATWNDTVHVVDIEENSLLEAIDLRFLEIWPYGIFLSSHYLAVAGFLGTGLLIDAEDHEILDQWGLGGITQVLDFNEDWIAAGMQGGKLVLIPRNDPLDPQYIYDLPDWPQDIELHADTVFVALGWEGLEVYFINHVADTVQPASVLSLEGINIVDVLKNEDFAFLAGGDSGIVVVDFSDPVQPVVASQIIVGEKVIALSSRGDTVYAGIEQGGVWEMDVSDPYHPLTLGLHPTFGAVLDMFVQDSFLYIGQGSNGLAIYDISSDNWQLEAVVESENVTFALSVDDDMVFTADGSAGIKAYGIMDPYHPIQTGSYNTGGSARDIAVFNDTVVVADGYDGICMLRYLHSGISELNIRTEFDRVVILSNPFNNWIVFNESVEAEIYDVYGRKQGDVDGSRYDARDMVPGVYFVKGDELCSKIVKISSVK